MNLDTLISKAKKKDRKAQKELFYHFSKYLMGVAVRYLDANAAEDAVQEAFVRIFKNLDRFEGENTSAFKAWSAKITANECIRYLKKYQKIQWDTLETSNEIKHSSLEFDDREFLLEVLNTLPEGYKVVFNLHVMEGFSHQEIANALGIQESTSRSQLTRAKKHLQNLLKKTHYGKVI